MNKRTLVTITALVAVLGFTLATVLYTRGGDQQASNTSPALQDDILVRPHSPVFGPVDAPVTIVEFFDPSCEACRAMYPYVKKLRTEYPDKVRIVIRYALFHQGSEEAARILEAARLQGLYKPVLDTLLGNQPKWAIHGAPDLAKAWQFAASAGLDVDQARQDMMNPDISAILKQDREDVEAAGVQKTPTFFVNGKPLPSFGVKQLYELVMEEVDNAG